MGSKKGLGLKATFFVGKLKMRRNKFSFTYLNIVISKFNKTILVINKYIPIIVAVTAVLVPSSSSFFVEKIVSLSINLMLLK